MLKFHKKKSYRRRAKATTTEGYDENTRRGVAEGATSLSPPTGEAGKALRNQQDAIARGPRSGERYAILKKSPRKGGRAFAARPKDPGGAFAKAMKVSPTSKDADEDLHCIAIRRRTFIFFGFRRCAFKLSQLFVDPSKMFVDHSKMFVDPSKMFVDEHF